MIWFRGLAGEPSFGPLIPALKFGAGRPVRAETGENVKPELSFGGKI